MWGDNCQLYMIICPPYYNYIYILFQLHKHRVQSTHLNEKSRQIFQSLSWLVSPCRTQANKPKLSFTIVFRNVDSGAKQSAAQRCEHRQLKYKIFVPNRDQEWQILEKWRWAAAAGSSSSRHKTTKQNCFRCWCEDRGLCVAAGQCLDTPVTAILRRAPASPPSRDLAFSSPNDGE